MLSCCAGAADVGADVGVGVVMLVVILGSIGGIDVSMGSGAATCWASGNAVAAEAGMVVGFMAAVPSCEVLGIVSSTGLPETGTTV